jgi:hypothetical protein
MTDNEIMIRDIRVMVSGCAALLASLMCHNLGHFTITPSQPSTWHVATQHRCGWVLIATCTWFLYEISRRIYTSFSSNEPAPRR